MSEPDSPSPVPAPALPLEDEVEVDLGDPSAPSTPSRHGAYAADEGDLGLCTRETDTHTDTDTVHPTHAALGSQQEGEPVEVEHVPLESEDDIADAFGEDDGAHAHEPHVDTLSQGPDGEDTRDGADGADLSDASDAHDTRQEPDVSSTYTALGEVSLESPPVSPGPASSSSLGRNGDEDADGDESRSGGAGAESDTPPLDIASQSFSPLHTSTWPSSPPPPPTPPKDTPSIARFLNSPPPPPTPPKDTTSPALPHAPVFGHDDDGQDISARTPPTSTFERLLDRDNTDTIAERRNTPVEPIAMSRGHSGDAGANGLDAEHAHRGPRSPGASTPPRPRSRSPRPTSLLPSSPLPTSPARSSFGSPHSPRVASPSFRTVDVPMPSLTAAVVEAEEEDGDPGGMYESIPLDGAGARPRVPAGIAIPVAGAVPTSASVRSSHESVPDTPLPVNGNGHATTASVSTTASATASAPNSATGGSTRGSMQASTAGSGASTPRRAAPPAHPHPFPIPSSPPPTTGPVAQVTLRPGSAGVSPVVAVTEPDSATSTSAPGSGPGSPPPPQSPPTPHHRPGGGGIGVKGKSTLDKFISRTRPSHLPPKDKTEDEEHLHAWEHMMAKSREHETERLKQLETRRLARERHLIAVTPRWEALLNDKEFSPDKVRTNPIHRQLWFEGIPPQLRGRAWSLAIGNPLALHKDAYNTYVKRSRRAQANGRFPPDILARLDDDLDTTLPTLHVFQRSSPMRDDLHELVCAWVVYRSDEGLGYAPYITLLAAMFLLVSPLPVAFLSLVNLMSRAVPRAFAAEDREEIDGFYRVFENLQGEQFPRIYANCKNLGLKLPESYFRSMLVDQVPFDTACRLWDQIVLDGDGYIFRAALAIFGFLEPRLYYPDRDEIESVLEGRNAATMAIQERERERARLRGEHYEEALDGKLSVFGLHEEPLFEWLAHDGWKESRYERLVMRELPD